MRTVTKENSSGYKQTIDVYQCKDCDGCPLRSECTKAKQGRTVQRNEKWLSQKVQVNELFEDAEYKAIAKRRSIECETVFGQIKGNQKFRRFLLRGKEKVGTEWGLLLIGYNIKTMIWTENEKKKKEAQQPAA
ncbi:transposase [Treponema vincentii]|uniref:transposase n=1 Tax=Treponema vincentii TaxID=69710 RepID=UPI0035F536E0